MHPVLEAIRAKRGYVLPHHQLLTLLSPELAASYDATYGTLALDTLVLPMIEKEFVWLVVVASVGSQTAGHHVRRFRENGGTEAQIVAALRLTAFAAGRTTFAFAGQHWDLPGFDVEARYRDALDHLMADTGIPPTWIEPALAAAYTCRQDREGIASHILGAYRAGVSERGLAEAMGLAIQPAGLPAFNLAGRVWRDLIRAGAVSASPEFAAWANGA